MKPLVACLLAVALSSPIAAHADGRARRLTIAGAVLTAAGGAMTIAGASLVTYGELNPPPPIDVVQPRFCSTDTCGNFPQPTNWPVLAGTATLAIGAAALGSGIALVLVGKRRERPSLVLSAGALRVHF